MNALYDTTSSFVGAIGRLHPPHKRERKREKECCGKDRAAGFL